MAEELDTPSFFEKIADPDETKGQNKVSIHTMIAIIQEVATGRLDKNVAAEWLTQEEMDHLGIIAQKVANGEFTLFELENIFILGETGIYTPDQIAKYVGL